MANSLLLLVAATAAGLSQEPPPAPAGLSSYFSNDDYPAEALRRREQGTVSFRIAISETGRVSDCQILGSSGSVSLDEATCGIARERLRFRPASDAAGDPVSDTKDFRVVWRLPGG